MSDITYCTIENIKEITSIVSTVDPSYIEPHIETAEFLNIVPVLGTALDTELKGEIEAGTISGANETLWTHYIIPASAWKSYENAIPFMAMKTFNKGIVRQGSTNSDPATLEEVQYLRQSIKDIAESLINNLILYLQHNENLYPNYRCDNTQYGDNDATCIDCPEKKLRYSGGIFL